MPGLPDLVTIIAILIIALGVPSIPRMGEALGRWLAAKRRSPDQTPPQRGHASMSNDSEPNDG